MSDFVYKNIVVRKLAERNKYAPSSQWQCPMCCSANSTRYKNCNICNALRVGRRYAVKQNGGGKPDTQTLDMIEIEVKNRIAAGEWKDN